MQKLSCEWYSLGERGTCRSKDRGDECAARTLIPPSLADAQLCAFFRPGGFDPLLGSLRNTVFRLPGTLLNKLLACAVGDVGFRCCGHGLADRFCYTLGGAWFLERHLRSWVLRSVEMRRGASGRSGISGLCLMGKGL